MHSTTYLPATVTDDPTPYRTKTGKPVPAARMNNLRPAKPPYLFTKANAKEMSERAAAKRRQIKAELADRLKAISEPDDFQKESLQRLREILRRLDMDMAMTQNAARLDRLAIVRGRLAAQEAELAGRPRSTARTKGQPTAAPLIQGD